MELAQRTVVAPVESIIHGCDVFFTTFDWEDCRWKSMRCEDLRVNHASSAAISIDEWVNVNERVVGVTGMRKNCAHIRVLDNCKQGLDPLGILIHQPRNLLDHWKQSHRASCGDVVKAPPPVKLVKASAHDTVDVADALR